MNAPCCSYQPFQPILTAAGLTRSNLIAEQTAPGKLLTKMVHSYLQIRVKQFTPYHLLPDGTQALFISSFRTKLSGALRTALAVPLSEPGDYFGIRFYPGVLRHFFDLDLAELGAEFVDQSSMPKLQLEDLQQQIYLQDSFAARAKVCEQWLLERYKPSLERHFNQVLNVSYGSAGNIRVAQLAHRIGWSERHLNRQFRYHTGFNTKAFLQILRLQNFYRLRYQSLDCALSSASSSALPSAVEAGYYDQAHCLKESARYVPIAQRMFVDQVMSDFSNL